MSGSHGRANTQNFPEFAQNPTYGRQCISRPMRIVAPIPCPRIHKNPNFLTNGKIFQNIKKLKNIQKYAKISATPIDQRSLIHREVWFPGGPRRPKKTIFFLWKKSSKTPKLKKSRNMPKLVIHPSIRALIHREAQFPTCFVRQNQPKKHNFFCLAILDHFKTKMFKSETTSYHYFSPRIPNL